jgi:Nucleotidyl transferase AbiEii toxin, Type IV TA system
MIEDPHGIMGWLGKPREFQAAVEFTAAETGFVPALIEKDFWCSAVLWRLFANDDCPLVFKGGTLLSKAYVVFNRLSEDLDFTLPTVPATTRGRRRQRAEAIAASLTATTTCLPLGWGEWKSFNLSSQH